MKTREEIIDHIKNVGYGKKAMREICAFLVGKEIKGKDEKFLFKVGEKSFDDFYNWYNEEVNENLFDVYFTGLEDRLQDVLDRIKPKEKEYLQPKFKVGDCISFDLANNHKAIAYVVLEDDKHINVENGIMFNEDNKTFSRPVSKKIFSIEDLYDNNVHIADDESKLRYDIILARQGIYFDKEKQKFGLIGNEGERILAKQGDIITYTNDRNWNVIIGEVNRISFAGEKSSISKYELNNAICVSYLGSRESYISIDEPVRLANRLEKELYYRKLNEN